MSKLSVDQHTDGVTVVANLKKPSGPLSSEDSFVDFEINDNTGDLQLRFYIPRSLDEFPIPFTFELRDYLERKGIAALEMQLFDLVHQKVVETLLRKNIATLILGEES